MTQMTRPTAVHLVGSIGLDTVEDVFRTVGKTLGPYLRRAPDGEVGGRKLWISWQYPLLRANTFLRPDPSGAVRPAPARPGARRSARAPPARRGRPRPGYRSPACTAGCPRTWPTKPKPGPRANTGRCPT